MITDPEERGDGRRRSIVVEHTDGAAARGEFARLLREAAAAQAVAEAEEAVCAAWTHHLNRLVDTTRQEVDTARLACRAARDLLRAVEGSGDPDALNTTQTVLETAEANQQQTVAEARQVLTAVRLEIDAIAAAERSRDATLRRTAQRVAALRGESGS
jgi:hypothetical protein